jgi:hypothetical protein
MVRAEAVGRRNEVAMSKTISVIFGIVLALLSIFFVFYTARLLYVTRGLTAIRGGGQGAYVGATVFPLLALLFGWAAWRLLRLKK